MSVSEKVRGILRNVFRDVERSEWEHAQALALLNRLSPNPPQWARDAVAGAWREVESARARETLALASLANR